MNVRMPLPEAQLRALPNRELVKLFEAEVTDWAEFGANVKALDAARKELMRRLENRQ